MDMKWYFIAMIVIAVVFGGGVVVTDVVETIYTANAPVAPVAGQVVVPTLLSHPKHPQVSAVLIMSEEDAETFMSTPGTWRVLAPTKEDADAYAAGDN